MGPDAVENYVEMRERQFKTITNGVWIIYTLVFLTAIGYLLLEVLA